MFRSPLQQDGRLGHHGQGLPAPWWSRSLCKRYCLEDENVGDDAEDLHVDECEIREMLRSALTRRMSCPLDRAAWTQLVHSPQSFTMIHWPLGHHQRGKNLHFLILSVLFGNLNSWPTCTRWEYIHLVWSLCESLPGSLPEWSLHPGGWSMHVSGHCDVDYAVMDKTKFISRMEFWPHYRTFSSACPSQL